MSAGIRRPIVVVVSCGVFGLAAGITRADVTIEQSMSVEGVGAMAFGNMNGTTKTVISGEKSRTDTEVKMQSKLVGFLARNAVGPSAEIVRLDQDRIDRLNINKKEYTETTFEQLHAEMQKLSDQTQQRSDNRQASAVDQAKCEWLPAKVSVNKTGEKAQFAGYDAERTIITASQPCQDKDSGSICEVAVVLDQWLSNDFAESPEVRRFYNAYAQKMGLDASSLRDVSQRAQSMFSQYKGIWTEVAAKMQNVKGYPVKTSFTLALGGAQCKDSKAADGQSGGSGDDSGSSGGISGLAGKLGGLFHKKKDDADAPAAQSTPAVAPVPLPAGDLALMTVSSQLVSVSTDSVNAEAFVVPADFKKQEPRTP